MSGKLTGKVINSADSIYDIAAFRTLNFLNRGKDYNYFQIVEPYRERVGYYYIYQSSKEAFSKVTDSDLLKSIKDSNKAYDGVFLDNSTDISKMYSEIKKIILFQDEQIMQILTSLYKNQMVVNSILDSKIVAKLKENIIVYGSTGTGKTEILKRIAEVYDVPIVIEDASSLSEVGYQGRDVTDMLENLYLAAEKDMALAQRGILVIDEFDKLAEKGNTDHVSRIGVQRSLLKLLDGSPLYFKNQKFDTSMLSVVALGAFDKIVNDDDYSKVTTVDFVHYGVMRELMGRFSKFIAMHPLSMEEIKTILIKSEFSPLNTYRLLFEYMNIQFSYEQGFVDYVAFKATQLKTGARSLKSIVDEEIGSALFRIFAGEYSAIQLIRPVNDDGKSYMLTKK